MYYSKFETWLCEMIIVGDEEGIRHLHLNTGEGNRTFQLSEEWIENSVFFKNEVLQIKDYLQGKRKTFDIKVNPEGTTFQKNIWGKLCTIPYGETASYKEIATLAGNYKASRAVGMANGKNPIPLIIPCHRVVGANGKLTGYAFGINVKKKILDFEKKYLEEL